MTEPSTPPTGVDAGADADPAIDPANTEIVQTHIENPDIEFTVHAEVEVAPSPAEESAAQETRYLLLTEGGPRLVTDGDAPFTFYSPTDPDAAGVGRAQAIVIADRAVAIGYFLFGLEQHDTGNGEQVALDSLGDIIDISPYLDMREQLDARDRRLRLLDWWEWRVDEGGDFAAGIYRDDATWRQTGLTDSGRTLAERIARDVPPEGRMCYYSAGEAAIHEIDNHRVEYVEGIAMPKHACQAVRHAWIEIDGRVAELTWPWHRFDATDAVYIGVPVDKERVKETRDRRERNGSVLLDDDEIETVTAAMRGDRSG